MQASGQLVNSDDDRFEDDLIARWERGIESMTM